MDQSAKASQCLDNNVKIKSKLQRYEEELSRFDDRKKQVIDIINKLKNLPFQPGDVAIHYELGNVLINDIRVPEESGFYIDRVNFDLDPHNSDSSQGPQALVITHIGAREWVSIKNLLPINSTSTVLYGKK